MRDHFAISQPFTVLRSQPDCVNYDDLACAGPAVECFARKLEAYCRRLAPIPLIRWSIVASITVRLDIVLQTLNARSHNHEASKVVFSTTIDHCIADPDDRLFGDHVRRAMHEMAMHEIDEWLILDGKRLRDQHAGEGAKPDV